MARDPLKPLVLPFTALLCLAAAGCHLGAPPSVREQQAVQGIRGRVEFAPGRDVQASTSDAANGATVSLIDTTTGQTVGTTVTEPSGAFTLNFGSSFRPVAGKPYTLEAVKGLPVGLGANRAGSSVARLRTLLFYAGTTWSSLTPGSVNLGPATTTVAAIVSLRGLSTSDQSALMGKVSGASLNASGTAIASSEFTHVYGLVTQALTRDQDPVKVLSYDSTGGTPATQYALRYADLVLHDTFTPAKALPGGNAVFNGQNLPTTEATVSIGGLSVATWSVNATRTQLSVTLPANAYGGLLRIEQGQSVWHGPYLPVAGTVGTLAGSGYGTLLDGNGTSAAFWAPQGLSYDAAGNLYVADSLNHAIRKVTRRGVVTTVAGGVAGFSEGTGTGAKFFYPRNLVVGADGNVYVADAGNRRIRRVTPEGVVTTFAGSTAGYADGTGTSARFMSFEGLTTDSAGNFWIAESGNQVIRKVTPDGTVSTFAGTPGATGSADGAASSASFWDPNGIAVDPTGNVFVTEFSNNRIRKITPAGVVSTLAGSTYGYAEGTGGAAQFRYPWGIVVDGAGNTYVGDSSNDRVRKVTPAGVTSTYLGGTRGYADDVATSACFFNVMGLAWDAAGNMAIVDRSNNRIRIYAP